MADKNREKMASINSKKVITKNAAAKNTESIKATSIMTRATSRRISGVTIIRMEVTGKQAANALLNK